MVLLHRHLHPRLYVASWVYCETNLENILKKYLVLSFVISCSLKSLLVLDIRAWGKNLSFVELDTLASDKVSSYFQYKPSNREVQVKTKRFKLK